MAKACAFTVPGALDSWEHIFTVGEVGTNVQLADVVTPIAGVAVKAKAANAGIVYVGGPDDCYFELSARESVNIGTDDLSKVYVRPARAGDGVCWLMIYAGV